MLSSISKEENMKAKPNPYKGARMAEYRSKTERVRVIAEMPPDLVDKIDAWGIPAGMRSRTDAIKHLVLSGLAAAEKEKADATAS